LKPKLEAKLAAKYEARENLRELKSTGAVTVGVCSLFSRHRAVCPVRIEASRYGVGEGVEAGYYQNENCTWQVKVKERRTSIPTRE
jgi:hypothetical protein